MKLENTIRRSMLAPNCKNIYALGNFASRITIYSQQIRALNLVWALHKTGKVSSSSTIGIVGGGIAGLTTAAALVVKGYKVVIFEKNKELMSFQKGSNDRMVHPHLYDWPNGNYLSDRAGLPILDWSAGTPNRIVTGMESQWNMLVSEFGSSITVLKNSPVVSCLERANGIEVTYRPPNSNQYKYAFDVLIYAGGFGLEKGIYPDNPFADSYWDDNAIHQDDRNGGVKKYAIFGCGDGGLVDYLRATLNIFDNGKLLHELAKNEAVVNLGQAMVKIDKTVRRLKIEDQSKALLEAYHNLKIPGELMTLISKNPRNTDVCLFGLEPSPFRLNTSLLNRLLTFIVTYKINHKLKYYQLEKGITPEQEKDLVDRLQRVGYRCIPRKGPNPGIYQDLGIDPTNEKIQRKIASCVSAANRFHVAQRKYWLNDGEFYPETAGRKNHSKNSTNILSLAHSDEGFLPDEIRFYEGNEKLIFAPVPPLFDAKEYADTVSAGFDKQVIEREAALIERERKNVSRLFIQSQDTLRPLHNSRKLGVFSIHMKRIPESQRNSIDFILYSTDYFTHTMSRNIYKELKSTTSLFDNYSVNNFSSNSGKYNFLSTSLGIYMLVEVKEGVVVTRRSELVSNKEEANKWHVTVDKGLIPDDLRPGRNVITNLALRGLQKEVGLELKTLQKHKGQLRYYDLFLEMKRYEIVLNGYLKLDMNFDELRNLYEGSSEGEGLESILIDVIPIKKEAVESFMQDNCTDALKYALKRLLSRNVFSAN